MDRHAGQVSTWAATVSSFAVCPIVEGALIRYLVHLGESAANAFAVLQAIRSMESVEFWPDTLSHLDADLSGVRGHRQVTDSYLASLAADRGGLLATLDESLAAERSAATLLI